LRPDIAERHLWRANVCLDHVKDGLIRLSFIEELDARELETFLPDVDRIGRPRTRVLATDFSPVGFVCRETNQLALDEDRHHQ
jgi:hypothetical protein